MKQLIWLGILLGSHAAHGQKAALPTAPRPTAGTAADSAASPAPPANGFGFDQGWAFDRTPAPPHVDWRSGYLRYQISIDASGLIVAAEQVAGDLNAEQDRLCRQHILQQFTVRKTRPDAAAATGFFTFRFRVE